MRKLVFATLAAVPVAALAFYPSGEPEFFVWTPPTTYENGEPLTPAEIQSYRLACSSTNPVGELERILPGGANSRWDVAEQTFAAGTWVCELYAVSTAGQESDPSLPVEVLVTDWRFQVQPSAPTSLQIG